MRELGFWDSVRFGADSEMIERMRVRFGRSSVISLTNSALLSFQRQLDNSLTGSNEFGYPGFLMGARLAYHRSSRRYHRRTKRLLYDFPQVGRPFAIPEPMRPEREVAKGERRTFDFILVSDFRLPGAVKLSNVARIKEEAGRGRRIGLIQLASYNFDSTSQVQAVFLDM